jgi:hypothetical protein
VQNTHQNHIEIKSGCRHIYISLTDYCPFGEINSYTVLTCGTRMMYIKKRIKWVNMSYRLTSLVRRGLLN